MRHQQQPRQPDIHFDIDSFAAGLKEGAMITGEREGGRAGRHYQFLSTIRVTSAAKKFSSKACR